MLSRGTFAIACGMLLTLQCALAQSDVDEMPGATRVVRAPEPPVAGLVRRDADADAVSFTLPAVASAGAARGDSAAPQLLLHDFDFNGEPVATDKLHLRQVAPGVVEITSVAWEVGYWRFYVRDAASYFGLGEHSDTLDHARTVVKNLAMDDAGVRGSATSKPVPFFMSTSGYGLWVDTTGEATFDLNASERGEIAVDVAAAKLRIVLFSGPKFPEILAHFTALAGRPVVPPLWAFAPWIALDPNATGAQVKEDVDGARAAGSPASVVLIDRPWAANQNGYKFDPQRFDDAAGMVKYLHAQGYKLVVALTPWIDLKAGAVGDAKTAGGAAMPSQAYRFAADQNLLVKNSDGSPSVGKDGDGSLIDFTYPKAKQWWQEQVRQAIAAGADGFKDEGGEGSVFGDAVKFADGSDRRVMRNRYGVLYNNAVAELIEKDLKGNGVMLAESGTAGAVGRGFLLSGGEASVSGGNDLRGVVTAGLGAGLSGMPLWTAEMGGVPVTYGSSDVRLLERCTEYAAFSPMMFLPRIGEGNSLPGSQDVRDVVTRYAVLHMSLLPYRYAAAQEAAKTGMPMMRALALNYQDDARTRAVKDEYLFGPDFLVAPVVDEGTQRAVYLPAGGWVNYWTGTVDEGGKVVLVDAPVDTIPVWARAGAVIPKIPEDVMTLVPASDSGNTAVHALDDRRVYEVIGGEAAEATTRTDSEGRSLTRGPSSLTIAGGPLARVTLRWRFGAVASATVNGVPATLHSAPDGPWIEFVYRGQATVRWE